MSELWHWFIAALVVINVGGSLWLMFHNARVPREELEDGDTTGHTWDGDLEEYNNPLPMWWMGLFVISAIWLVISWPLTGAIGWKWWLLGQGVGWPLQILGHAIEGNRPAFFKDPWQLTIGPLFIVWEPVRFLMGRPVVELPPEPQG